MTVFDIPDIGHGAGLAVVLQTPAGKTYLYDTGVGYPEGDGWAGNHNTARDLIIPFIQKRGITYLDGIIISHAHYDHFGGLLWLVNHFPIDKLIDSGYEFRGECDEHYETELRAYERLRERFKAQATYEAVQAGNRLGLDPGLEVEALSPPATFFSEERPEERPPNNPPAHYIVNANSLVVRIQHGQVIFLLPGDIELGDQLKFLLRFVPPEKLACDILVAPGHGLHSAPELAEATRPRVTIASVFERWADFCTARQVFSRYGSEVYVTGLHGNITTSSDGKRWEVRTDRFPSGADRASR